MRAGLADYGVGMGAVLAGRPRRARIDTLGRNAWPASGAVLDLDFVNNRGYVYGQGQGRLQDLLTITGANGTVTNVDGNLVAANAPRFDYDPVTHACLGVLIEEQRTNRMVRSADLTAAPWGGSCTAVLAAETYKGVPFYLVSKTQPAGSDSRACGMALSVAAGYWVLQTFALLAGTQRGAMADVSAGLYAGTWGAAIDSTCRILEGPGTVQGSSALWSILGLSTTVPTLVCISTRFPAGATNPTMFFYPGSSGDVTVGDNVKITRVDVQASGNTYGDPPFPTSYIPTSGAAVTRTGENIYISGQKFSDFYNQEEQTLFGIFDKQVKFYAPSCVIDLINTSNYEQIALDVSADNAGRVACGVEKLSPGQVSVPSIPYTLGTPVRVAMSRSSAAGVACAMNGVLGGKTSAPDLPAGGIWPAFAYFGQSKGSAAPAMGGHMKRAVIWPRKFSETELQALTA